MQPIILHLDMNSFFASCEQQDNPAWRGKVLGVCEHLGGIIIAASLEAKKWGIKTGTPVWEARKLYPKIILTHTRPEAYRNYNRKLVKIVSNYTDEVEVYSIDEVFLDITASCNVKFPISNFQFSNNSKISNFQFQKFPCSRRFILAKILEWQYADPFEEAIKIAKEIKLRMKKVFGDFLTCSIGIGENKLLAKIASDMQKPNGLTVVRPSNSCHSGSNKEQGDAGYPESISRTLGRASLAWDDRQVDVLKFTKDELYQKLKLIDIPGIGFRMEKRLGELGIKTLANLRNYPKSKLVALFGLPGYHLYNLGQLSGSFRPEVGQDENIKSMGHMYTLPQEFRKAEFFAPVLYKLCEMVGRRLRAKKLCGSTLFVHAHDLQDSCFGKIRRLKLSLWDGREIFVQSLKIFKDLKVANIPCKLVGITVGDLQEISNQLSLFKEEERARRLTEALDKINLKYGQFTLCRAEMTKAGKVFKDSIGFGRIKEMEE